MTRISERDRTREIMELISLSRSVGELSRFAIRSEWSANSRSGRNTAKFLYPHSEEYFSVLKPVFLHQIKSADVLSAYRPLLVRDGALGLLDFFLRYPAPPDRDCHVFLHADLAWTVPAAWDASVAYYRVHSVSPLDAKQVNDVYLVVSVIDDKQCSLSQFSARLHAVKRFFADETVRYHVTFLAAHVFGKNSTERDARSRLHFEMTRAALDVFGDDVDYVPWPEVQNRKLGASAFFEFNPRRFFYSDSFVTHQLLSKGGKSFGQQTPERPVLNLPLSFTHYYSISATGREYGPGLFQEVRSEWDRYTMDPLFLRDVRSFRTKRCFSGQVRYCAPAVESLAHHLVSKMGALDEFTPFL